MSPAGKAQCFAVQRGEINNNRFDTDFYHPSFRCLVMRFANFPNTALINEIVSVLPRTGFAAGKSARTDDMVGSVLQVRPTQILPDGELDLSESYRIARSNCSNDDLLREGEVLFNNTNSTEWVGKSAVYRERRVAVCSNHVTRLSLRPGYLSEYVAEVLNLLRRLNYFSTLCTNFNNQAGINTATLALVRIPTPPLAKQRELVAAMDAARAARRAKLAEAEALLAGMDEFILNALGLVSTAEDERMVYAVPAGIITGRLDPHFYLPSLAHNIKMLQRAGAKSLGTMVSFSNETWEPANCDAPTFRYIEISNVNTQTGETNAEETAVAAAPSRARMAVHTDDILVSLTRPHHGAIARITRNFDGCVASTGFSVLRGIKESRLDRDYLWCILRARFCLLQMLQRASGGNYPAITEAELAKVLVPVPDQSVQLRIANEAKKRLETAMNLRQEADQLWQRAKADFEAALLGKG